MAVLLARHRTHIPSRWIKGYYFAWLLFIFYLANRVLDNAYDVDKAQSVYPRPDHGRTSKYVVYKGIEHKFLVIGQ